MENKLDILTQKLYNEGVDKARREAENIINQAKMQIIGDNIQNADEIYNIVYNIAEQNGVSLSQDEMRKRKQHR